MGQTLLNGFNSNTPPAYERIEQTLQPPSLPAHSRQHPETTSCLSRGIHGAHFDEVAIFVPDKVEVTRPARQGDYRRYIKRMLKNNWTHRLRQKG